MNVLRHIVPAWRCEPRCWCVGDKALCGPTHYLRQRRFSEGGKMAARAVTCCNLLLIPRSIAIALLKVINEVLT